MKYNLRRPDRLMGTWDYYLNEGFYTQDHIMKCVAYSSKPPINTWADVEKYAADHNYDIINDDKTGVTL